MFSLWDLKVKEEGSHEHCRSHSTSTEVSYLEGKHDKFGKENDGSIPEPCPA